MTTDKSISRQIAEFAVGLKYDDIPTEAIKEAKRFLYDSIGCAYGASETKDVNAIRDIYTEMGGKGEATTIGFGDKLPVVNATLINSLMIRALDFNDIYWKEDPSHPSDIIPAALSVGEAEDNSMQDVLVGIILAYEFEMRLCEFAVPGVRERKWHHATLTQFVSPIVAGKLMGLSVDEMVNAIGINGCHNHTIGCPTAGKLTMMKNTVDPMATQAGVFASLMARKGYSGTEAVFEGKEGFMDCFGPDWNRQRLLDGFGDSYMIGQCGMKAFPTEALTHTHISCLLKVVIENDIKSEDIDVIIVTTIARACDILFDAHKYRPESRETADHSLPYCLAAAIVDREVTTQSFSDEKMKDPRIWDVIDKIKGDASEEFEKMFPAKQPSKVVVRTLNGKEYSASLDYPKGDPREPMSDDELRVKFNSLSASLISRTKQEEVRDLIYGCEKYSAREFMAGLVASK